VVWFAQANLDSWEEKRWVARQLFVAFCFH